jgi:hypothetical protein
MEVGTIALLIAAAFVGLAVVFVITMSSRSSSQAWQPVGPIETDKISPIALVEEAHTWYVASKQESNLLESLVRTSYGIACLRSIQNSMQLEEVKGCTLPPSVQGPSGLMAKLHSQQAVLLNALDSFKRQEPLAAAAPEPTVPKTQPSPLVSEFSKMLPYPQIPTHTPFRRRQDDLKAK